MPGASPDSGAYAVARDDYFSLDATGISSRSMRYGDDDTRVTFAPLALVFILSMPRRRCRLWRRLSG